jgi:putative adenylate-forming enzyme
VAGPEARVTADRVGAVTSFARARWERRPRTRAELEALQEARLARFFANVLPRAPFYRDRPRTLAELPVVDKAMTLARFAEFNTVGVTLDRALDVALAAERSRNFAPTLPGGITVGLSSGTSGTRGVFLVSDAERARWAGVLLARLLTTESLRRIAGWGPALRIAFFLRANSNLYGTLGSRRITFAFHDLLEPLTTHVARLNACPPHVLAAPPTVLRLLAEASAAGVLTIAPRQVVSVAEVLEADDATAIVAAWNVPVQQVYQATEGFLGSTCAQGRIHLNEDLLHIEPEWIADGTSAPTRFHPIVTDFTRTTQVVARYRLDDVLRVADGDCPCESPTQSLAAIEGRADDILWRPGADGRPLAVFPDVVRRAMALVAGLGDYRLEQHGSEWRVRVQPFEAAIAVSVRQELAAMTARLGAVPPVVRVDSWIDGVLSEKRRRIRCLSR